MPWETAEDVAADGEDEAQDAADGAANCMNWLVQCYIMMMLSHAVVEECRRSLLQLTESTGTHF